MTKLEKNGYRLNPKKYELLRKETEWVGHKTDQQGVRPLQDNLDAKTKINISKNEEKLKSISGIIYYISKYIQNLSTNTDIRPKLLKKHNDWIWTEEFTKIFDTLKEVISQISCPAHYNAKNYNIIKTDERTKCLGATIWKRNKDGTLKLISFVSRFLSDNQRIRTGY